MRAVVGEQALKLKGDFTWEESAAPSLTNLEVSVDSGDLMVVVGSTGSGKSSLLGAALGLMQQVEGEPVDLRGKASALHSPAYCCLSVKSLVPFKPLPTDAFRSNCYSLPCTYLAHHEPENVNSSRLSSLSLSAFCLGTATSLTEYVDGRLSTCIWAGALRSSSFCCPSIRCS